MPGNTSSAPSAGWLDIPQWTAVFADYDIDPYVLWALATEFRGFGRGGKYPGVLNLIAELETPLGDKDSAAFFESLNRSNQHPLKGYVPAAYFAPYPGNNPAGTRYVTLRLDVAAAVGASAGGGEPVPAAGWQETEPSADERKWIGQVIAELLLRLIRQSPIRRVQLGHSRGDFCPDRAPEGAAFPGPVSEVPEVLLASVEDTCPFFHAALRADPVTCATRVAVLWDQSVIAPQPRAVPHGFPYGTQWFQSDLNALATALNAGTDEQDLADAWERAAVANGRFASLRPRASHGAAVLGLLAGRRAAPALPMGGVLPGEGESWQPTVCAGDDAAAAAPLAVVQLPREQTQVSSGRWLAPHLLDALRYLLGWAWSFRANTAAGEAPPPLVVNVSYGSQTGPHDGTGILECAMDEMCDHYGADLALVLAAGNSHGSERDADDDSRILPGGIHGRATLPEGGKARFGLRVPPDKQHETALELWFDRRLADGEQLVVRLWKPGSSTAVGDLSVSLPGSRWLSDGSGKVIAGVMALNRVPQSTTKAMALVMVAATQMSTRHPEAPAGEWQLEVEVTGLSHPPLALDLWVERDDTVVGASRGQQARLRVLSGGKLTDEATFTHVAHGARPVVVTALRARDQAGTTAAAQPSVYSSAGRAHNPQRCADFSALVDPLRWAHGMRVMGNHSGVTVRANGTSLAAPQAARWLANQLAAGKSLTWVRGQIGASGPTARVGKVVP